MTWPPKRFPDYAVIINVEFKPAQLDGVFVIEPVRIEDERGFFARTWAKKEFEQQGLNPGVVQCNVSFSRRKGTMRGLHFQAPPHEEAKLVRCTAGAVFDVIVDLRTGSPTLGRWQAFELTSRNRWALYVPEGFAHGFQTLADDTEAFYQMTETYHLESTRGVNCFDPALAIPWPLECSAMSEKDRNFPPLAEEHYQRLD